MMRSKAGRLRGFAPTQVDYHWLWGLWVNRQASSPSRFGLEVGRLLGDKDALGQIKEQQERLARRPFVVRFFYWLFNVDNYAYHSHLLAACEAFKSTPNLEASASGDERGPASARQGNSPRARLGVGEDSRRPQTPPVGQEGIPSSSWRGEVPAPRGLSSEGSSVAATKATNPLVVVSYSMLAPLGVLGINKAVGEELSLEEFKKALKKKRLSTHPDKGGVGDAFTEVTRAIKALEGIFSKGGTPQRAGTYKSFYKAVAELSAEMAQMSRRIDELNAARAADRLEADRARADISAIQAELLALRSGAAVGRVVEHGGRAPLAAGGLGAHGVFGARWVGRGAGLELTSVGSAARASGSEAARAAGDGGVHASAASASAGSGAASAGGGSLGTGSLGGARGGAGAGAGGGGSSSAFYAASNL